MVILLIGLPGRFTEWCATAIAALLGRDVEVATVPSLGEMIRHGSPPAPLAGIARALIGTSARHLVVVVTQPDRRLRAALTESGARFVTALGHPCEVAAEVFKELGGAPHLAVRAVANSCATVMRLATLPGSLLVHGTTARAHPKDVIAMIAKHLGLPRSSADLTRAAARLEALPFIRAPNVEAFPPSAEKMMRGALTGYEACFAGQGMGPLAWNRELFAVADPDKRATEILDLAGGQRTLIFGPYIYLPPGTWTAKVFVGVSPEAVGHTLLIDAYSGAELAASSLQPAAGGIYATDVNFALDEEASNRPIEIRVSVMQPDAAGQLAFGRVVLEPHVSRRPDRIASLDDFASALDL